MVLKRKIYNKLLAWKKRDGATAILIEGARRCGKSFIAKEFAKNEYKSFILIDFSLEDSDIIALFNKGFKNMDNFFMELQFLYGSKLFTRKSLIIFDEVQLFPKARQAIKHLVADGRYDYIETGSLISIKQNVEGILLPSEENKLSLYPMDFEEFLWANGNEYTVPMLREKFNKLEPLDIGIHRVVLRDFRKYMMVGGMPSAILEYVKSEDFEKVDSIKKDILEIYRNDVGKFAGNNKSKVLNIFDGIPGNLALHDKKFNFASLSKNARYREYEDSFIWLQEALITNCCYRVSELTVALGLSMTASYFKNYMMDTGLLITMSFYNETFLNNEIYKALLLDKLNINEGMITENIVAQQLKANNHKLLFYASTDKNNRKIEVDFLLSNNQKVTVIEVKSSKYNSHKSLDILRNRSHKLIDKTYIIYTKNLKVEDDIIYLPIYMTMFL